MQTLRVDLLVEEADDEGRVDHAEYVHAEREYEVLGEQRHGGARRRQLFRHEQNEHNCLFV